MTLLRHGQRGQAVRQLQQQLNLAGAELYVDGHFGDATEAAVRVYQRQTGLVPDGIAGPKTQAALANQDDPRLLRNRTLTAIAERLRVEPAALYAINEVESRGQGFLPNGKPVILFERHIMYRQLSATRPEQADPLAALHPNLINPRPGGYVGGTAEHQRLANARLLDDSCALQSTSWGAFQIMGFHWQRLGYPSVQAFATAMEESEDQQFEAFARFIETDPQLLSALQGKRWAAFARLYNGPAYARNLYDVKLARAYKRHANAENAA
jgi:hypothetical protein